MATHYRVEPDGSIWREQHQQVGWRGQSGAFYPMGSDPSKTEPGSFAPMFVVVEADRAAMPEMDELQP